MVSRPRTRKNKKESSVVHRRNDPDDADVRTANRAQFCGIMTRSPPQNDPVVGPSAVGVLHIRRRSGTEDQDFSHGEKSFPDQIVPTHLIS